MDLRMLEISVPIEAAEKARGYIEESPILGVWEVPLAGESQTLFRALVETKHSQSLLDRVEHHFIRPDGDSRIALLAVRATVPPPVDEAPAPAPASRLARWHRKNLVSREELLESIDDAAEFSSTQFVLVLLSTLVAAIGLLGNDPAVIIGAMVIAPLLGPNIALALATCLGNSKLALASLRTQAIGLILALVVSMGIGALLPFGGFPAPAEILSIAEIEGRTAVAPTTVALALVSGTAGALAFATGSASTLIGVMVAVALMPPLVTVGILGGAGRWAESSQALTLLATNVICVNLSAIGTFLFHGIYPSASKWRDHRKARRTARIGLIVWGFLLIGLVAYHFGLR